MCIQDQTGPGGPHGKARPQPGELAGLGGPGLLDELGALAVDRAATDASLVRVAHHLVAATMKELLQAKGYSSVDELSRSACDRLRTEAKRAAVAEVRLRLGVKEGEARALVGMGCAPAPVRDPAVSSMARGESTWGLVRAFWDRCGRLPADRAELIAESLFGDDASSAAVERLDADGDLRDTPWQQEDYDAALEREATRLEGADVQAERERRRLARAARRSWLTVHPEGTATLSITGALTTMAAIHSRIEHAARALRKGGDERTLDQLRSDIPCALLLHGVLPLPVPDDPDDLTVTDIDAIERITNAAPLVSLQVIVPVTALTGGGCVDGELMSDGGQVNSAPDATYVGGETPDERGRQGSRPSLLEVEASDDLLDEPAHRPSGDHAGDARAGAESSCGRADGPGRYGRGEVGYVLGRHPAYVSPGEVRELALLPGTTLSRLLVDPADGRLVERTIARYRPDADMRRQVMAADVHARAPGCRIPAARCELDHVTPYGPEGGPTAEPNLATLNIRAHQLKTAQTWSVSINDRRDLAWCTLLGQTATTRAHDYRQYLDRKLSSADGGTGETGTSRSGQACGGTAETGSGRPGQACGGTGETGRAAAEENARDSSGGTPPTWEQRQDLACQALYAALVHRGPHAFLGPR